MLRSLFALALLLGFATTARAQAQTPPADLAVTLTAEQRALYVGSYALDTPDGPMTVAVFQQGEQLIGQPENGEGAVLVPLGNHKFRVSTMYETFVTFILADGKSTGFSLVSAEHGTLAAKKKAQ